MKLFEPIRIGSLVLKNRLVMAPMATNYAEENGEVTERMKNYYVERARGGVGLIIMESGYVNSLGRGGKGRMGIHEDSLVPGLKDLVDRVHAEGAFICSQLHHAGRQINVMRNGGIFPVSASSIPAAMEGVVPRTLKIWEIEELVEEFGLAAERSLAAGFDAILIHAAHGYLLHQFLSPLSNTRNDRYGGNFNKRLRFLKDVFHRCLETVGREYPLMVRISGSEFIRGGFTLKDAQKIALNLEKWGVKAIHITGGCHETQEMQTQPMRIPRGCLVKLAEVIKNTVQVPVATVGRIVDPMMAEEILQQGKADLITLGRALLADPEFPYKAQEGRWKDIRPCIACLQGCLSNLYQALPITCLVNPQVGLEMEYRIKPAKNRKRIFIIGGGPGGMEAARVAALRGHTVTLVEKNDHLGGQFKLASYPPGKGEIRGYLEYLSRQLENLGVKVILNRKISSDKLDRIDADVIILANGGSPQKIEIPGINLENVFTAWEVLRDAKKVGKRVVVVGGGAVGAETADYLADRGRDVTLIEMAEGIALDKERLNRKLLMRFLGEKGVHVRIMTKATAVTTSGLEVENNSHKETLLADTVVLATGTQSDKSIGMALKNLNSKIYSIGDCVSPRNAFDAIHQGYKLALRL